MNWYWILLMAIAYLPMGGILEGLLERWNIFEGTEDSWLICLTVILWPFMFPFCMLGRAAQLLSNWVANDEDDDDDPYTSNFE